MLALKDNQFGALKRAVSALTLAAFVTALAPTDASAAKKTSKPAKAASKDTAKKTPESEPKKAEAKKTEALPVAAEAKPSDAEAKSAEPKASEAKFGEAKSTESKTDMRAVEAEAKPKATDSTAKKLEPADNFDFDLLDKPAQPALDPEAAARIDAMVKTRRTLLNVHFALGLSLVVASTASSVLGTLHYWDKYGGGGYKETFRYPHLVATMATSGIFATQGILALAAPEPYEREGKWDTARIHRILEIAATVGMVAQIVLGFVTAYGPGLKGTITERDLARAHLGIGWATWAFTNAGAAAYLF